MAFLPAAAVALQAASQAIGGIQQNKAMKGVARVETENARLSELSGALEATASLRDDRMAAGADFAAMGASGAAFGGSTSDIIIAQSVEAQMRGLQARYAAAGEAAQARQRAADAKRAGKAALVNGFLGAATSAVQGIASMRADARRAKLGESARNATMKSGNPVRASTPIRRSIPLPRTMPGGARNRSVGVYSG